MMGAAISIVLQGYMNTYLICRNWCALQMHYCIDL